MMPERSAEKIGAWLGKSDGPGAQMIDILFEGFMERLRLRNNHPGSSISISSTASSLRRG